MPRQRYRQNPLPLGPDAPPVELYGPEQPTPPGLQVAEQGQLGVVPLGPLFEAESELTSKNTAIKGREKLVHDLTKIYRPARGNEGKGDRGTSVSI